MSKFRVVFAVNFDVEADSEEEAYEKASEQLERKLQGPFYDLFGTHIEEITEPVDQDTEQLKNESDKEWVEAWKKKVDSQLMKLLVVDSNNHWLFVGDVKNREEAVEQAKLSGLYDVEAELIVYEVKKL